MSVDGDRATKRLAERGRVALVTGGTDGIGKAIARGLAEQGIAVVVVGSNAEKGEAAVRDLRAVSRNPEVHFVQADLSLIRNVDALAAQICARWPRLHYLVLCAGIVRGRRVLTAEGLESNFALDYLSRFALTQRLLGSLTAAACPGAVARILVISGAANGRIHYEDINLADGFNTLRAVSQFCEANDVFVIEQARRLAKSDPQSRVTIAALKVGAVRTNIRREFPLWMKVLVPLLIDPFLAIMPEAVGASALRLLLAPEFEGGTGALFTQIKRFKPTAPGRRTADGAEGHRLWDLSERLTARARAASA